MSRLSTSCSRKPVRPRECSMLQAMPAEQSVTVGLGEMQSRFLRGLHDARADFESLDRSLFLDPPAGTIEGRWAIYRNAYVVRLVESIATDYPAVARIVGHSQFHTLCQRYLKSFPPYSHDIGRAGERLPAFLPGDPIAAALPFLPDLASLERALAVSIGSPDDESSGWSDIAALPVELLALTPLRLAPAAALIASEWPLASLWLAKDQPDSSIDIPLEGPPSTILVSRRGLSPRWRSIDHDDRIVVEGALRGATPADLLESGEFGGEEEASLRLVQALRRVADDGALNHPFFMSAALDSAPRPKEVP